MPRTIKEWQVYIYNNAKNKGWWDKPRNEGELLMLIVDEVAEAHEQLRLGHTFPWEYEVEGKPEGVPSELADIIIRVWDMAEHYGIDMDDVITRKMAYNETRPYRHGGKTA